jgi:hypothetical protein
VIMPFFVFFANYIYFIKKNKFIFAHVITNL